MRKAYWPGGGGGGESFYSHVYIHCKLSSIYSEIKMFTAYLDAFARNRETKLYLRVLGMLSDTTEKKKEAIHFANTRVMKYLSSEGRKKSQRKEAGTRNH